MKELIILSRREAQRIQVLEQVVRESLSLKAGATLMKVCYRQAKRLVARYRREGPKGLAHRRRGRAAPNALGPEIRERVLALHREVYSQFNDTHFVEMLEEREGLRIGRETVRRWLREAGIRPKRRRRPPQHRSRRPRRPQIGLLMQWDGSPHLWFGPQRPAASLLHAADDGRRDRDRPGRSVPAPRGCHRLSETLGYGPEAARSPRGRLSGPPQRSLPQR